MASSNTWLLLVHQLPAKPAYLRVKVWRTLHAIGAVALKSGIYVLPAGEETRKAFESLVAGIVRQGGDGAICESRFVSGIRDDEVRALFHAARDADYDALVKDLRFLSRASGKAGSAKNDPAPQLPKYRERLAEIERIDFFGSSGRMAAEALLSTLQHRAITREKSTKKADIPFDPTSLVARTWVTRQGIHVDRIACAWLIKRFIDPKAQFKFVADKQYRPLQGELRFDMHEGEFTHEGDKCSFEVLLERVQLKDRALQLIAEVIHDADLKDGKFARPETLGISHVIAGICRIEASDEGRMARGAELFNQTYEQFRRGNK